MADKPDKLPICGKRYLTMEELCEYLGISKWTVYRLIDKRDIPFSVIGRRSYRFDRQKIDEWMAKRSMKTIDEI